MLGLNEAIQVWLDPKQQIFVTIPPATVRHPILTDSDSKPRHESLSNASAHNSLPEPVIGS